MGHSCFTITYNSWLWASCSHTYLQYQAISFNNRQKRWRSAAGQVTMGLAEINHSCRLNNLRSKYRYVFLDWNQDVAYNALLLCYQYYYRSMQVQLWPQPDGAKHRSLHGHHRVTSPKSDAVSELVGLYSTHNRSFWRRAFPNNWLHWYWQSKTKEQSNSAPKTQKNTTQKNLP